MSEGDATSFPEHPEITGHELEMIPAAPHTKQELLTALAARTPDEPTETASGEPVHKIVLESAGKLLVLSSFPLGAIPDGTVGQISFVELEKGKRAKDLPMTVYKIKENLGDTLNVEKNIEPPGENPALIKPGKHQHIIDRHKQAKVHAKREEMRDIMEPSEGELRDLIDEITAAKVAQRK